MEQIVFCTKFARFFGGEDNFIKENSERKVGVEKIATFGTMVGENEVFQEGITGNVAVATFCEWNENSTEEDVDRKGENINEIEAQSLMKEKNTKAEIDE